MGILSDLSDNLNGIMENMAALSLHQLKDGEVMYRWPTQSFKGTVCELSYTGFDLYDGFLGNLLISYFYSEYFDNAKKIDYYNYLLCFQRILLKEHDCLDLNVGAYGDLGGALFVLTTLYVDSGNSRLLPLLLRVYQLIDQQIDKINSADYIYGLSGLMDRLTYSEKCKMNEVYPLLERCREKLLRAYSNENATYGYAHGVFSSVAILEKNNIIDSYSRLPLNELLEKTKNFRRRKSSWEYSWCSGELGELYTYLVLFHKNDNDSLLNYILDRFYLIFRKIKELSCPNYSLCHGILGTLDLGQMLYQLAAISQNDFHELIYMILNKPFPNVDYQYSSNGVMVGRLGKAYQILRFILPDRVPSLLVSL